MSIIPIFFAATIANSKFPYAIDSLLPRAFFVFGIQPFKALLESLFNDPQDPEKRSFHFHIRSPATRSLVILF